MSDSFDNLLAGLQDEPEEEKAETPPKPARAARKAPRKPSRGKTPAKAEEAPRAAQRGRRGDPNYSQVNANIPNELKASLFFYLKMEGRTLEEVIEEALSAYVEERGGLINAPAGKGKRKS